MAKQDDWVRLTVRLPQEVYERLQAAIIAGPNSMNAEIVARLDRSLEEDRQLPKAELSMFYSIAAAVAEQTVTQLLHAWLGVAENSAKEAEPVRALRYFLAHRPPTPFKPGEQPVESRKWSNQEIVEFARQLVAAQDDKQSQEPSSSKKTG